MTAHSTQQKQFSQSKYEEYKDRVGQSITLALRQFIKINRSYVYFHLGAIFLILLELFASWGLFAYFPKSAALAISIAVLFLTGFAFFVLRLYVQAKRPEQIHALLASFIDSCKQNIGYQEFVSEHYLALADALCLFGSQLRELEYNFYQAPKFLNRMAPAFQYFSCWWHWQDTFRMQESLLSYAVHEHVKLVKCEPTSLEAHAALANAYVLLSNVYQDPRISQVDDQRWIPSERFSPMILEQFRATARKAVEELKIINDYAPNDPWVHVQLAYNYHDLQMFEEEIGEYEKVLALCPGDKETLFKLGILYFQQGQNARGLQVYEEIKRSNFSRAEDLIKFYGSADCGERFSL